MFYLLGTNRKSQNKLFGVSILFRSVNNAEIEVQFEDIVEMISTLIHWTGHKCSRIVGINSTMCPANIVLIHNHVLEPTFKPDQDINMDFDFWSWCKRLKG